MYVSLCLSVFLTICLSIFLSIDLFMYISLYVFVYPYVPCMCACARACMCVHLYAQSFLLKFQYCSTFNITPESGDLPNRISLILLNRVASPDIQGLPTPRSSHHKPSTLYLTPSPFPTSLFLSLITSKTPGINLFFPLSFLPPPSTEIQDEQTGPSTSSRGIGGGANTRGIRNGLNQLPLVVCEWLECV